MILLALKARRSVNIIAVCVIRINVAIINYFVIPVYIRTFYPVIM